MFMINGVPWDIEYVDSDSNLLLMPNGEYTLGCADNSVQIVYLSDDIYGDTLQKVLAHEICHAVCFSYSLNLSDDEEEKFCDLIATYGFEILDITDMLYQIFRRVA